jgi:hypothetical protein
MTFGGFIAIVFGFLLFIGVFEWFEEWYTKRMNRKLEQEQDKSE